MHSTIYDHISSCFDLEAMPHILLWLIPDAASLLGSDVITLHSVLFLHFRNATPDLSVTLPYQQKTFSVRV